MVHRIQVDAVHVVGHEVGDLLGSVEDAGGTQGLDVVPHLFSRVLSLSGMREALRSAMRRTDLAPRTGMMPASIGTVMAARALSRKR